MVINRTDEYAWLSAGGKTYFQILRVLKRLIFDGVVRLRAEFAPRPDEMKRETRSGLVIPPLLIEAKSSG